MCQVRFTTLFIEAFPTLPRFEMAQASGEISRFGMWDVLPLVGCVFLCTEGEHFNNLLNNREWQ